MSVYLGVDPGASGALALVDVDGRYVEHMKLAETEHDVAGWLRGWAWAVRFACLERVSAMPRQGVASSFKFGSSAGFCRGLLVAYDIPHELVSPAVWQGGMKCRSGGDKNKTKAAAQALWSGQVKVTHAIADALLLAEYCRRTRGAGPAT